MLSISLHHTMLSWLGILWVVIRGAWSHNEAAMSSLLRQKLSARQPGTATPLSYNNLPTQWALSSDERTGGAGWRCGGRGEEWLRLRVRTGQGDDSAALSLSIFFGSGAGGHHWETEQKSMRPTLWMQIVLHCTRLPQSSEGAGHLFCEYYECQGLFSGSSRTRMFSLSPPHRGRTAGFYFVHMETVGLITL